MKLEPAATSSEAAAIFGFAQFLSILALFVTIFNVSDFRYRYRALLWLLNIRTVSVWAAFAIGVILFVVEFWFQNHLPVPHFLNSYANIKLIIAATFAGSVLIFVAACFVWPVRFRQINASRFYNVTSYYVHQGNSDRLQAIADVLSPAMEDLFVWATKVSTDKNPSITSLAAHDTMLVLADRRFCQVVVDRVPGLALRSFQMASAYPDVPFADFAHFIGAEFITNTNSVFYQEDMFGSGYSRHAKPISRAVFGDYKLVERLASQRLSPLDLDYHKVDAFGEQHFRGFFSATTTFTAAYFEATKGRSHSYAFARLLGTWKGMATSLSKLEGRAEALYQCPAYAGANQALRFIAFAVKELDRLGIRPVTLRETTTGGLDPYDGLADLYYDIILSSSSVTRPEFTCWDVQHNLVWTGELRFYHRSKALAALNVKIRRKLYDKIREMDRFPNFVGARILGFCLNVFGLRAIHRHKEAFHRTDYALQRVVLHWAKRRFRWIAEEYPNLLNVSLQGFISYDQEKRRLVQGTGNKIKHSEERLSYLDLD